MKKISGILLAILMVLFLAVQAYGADIYVVNVFSGEALEADSGVSSQRIDLNVFKPQSGTYGLFVNMDAESGASVTVKYYVSNDNITYVTPADGTLFDEFTAGVTFVQFTPIPARYLKIEVLEAGAISGVASIDASLSIR